MPNIRLTAAFCSPLFIAASAFVRKSWLYGAGIEISFYFSSILIIVLTLPRNAMSFEVQPWQC
jgi:hypothetical protein